LILLAFLLAIDLLAFAARVSFMQITHIRVLSQREQSGGKINRTLALLPALPKVRATLNLLLVMTRCLLAGLALYMLSFYPVIYPVPTALIVLLIASLVLFWLEWVTEQIVMRQPKVWAVRLSGFVGVLKAILAVFLAPVALSKESQSTLETSAVVTEDELKTLVDAGQEEGVFEQGERKMIYSVFALGDTLAREIMVPRTDMLALEVQTPLPEAVDALLQAGHSRVPVYEESVDHTLGLLYAKDLLRAWRENQRPASIGELLRPAYFIPEAKKVDELLADMQSQRIHMAIVVDEYGGVAGLVTLEDIVEEVLGEIQDEYDQGEEAPYQEQADGSYLFLGRIDLEDFNEIMGANLSREEADTLGGYIYHHLGRVPGVGDEVKTGDIILKVEQVTGRRIRKVRACWSATAEQKEEDKESVDR
jgi:CBS domain containing-hemolysin-like protein